MIEITVALTDDVYERVEHYARLTGLSLEEVITQGVDLAFPMLPWPSQPVTELNDSQVIALADLQMEAGQAQRHQALLQRQSAATLTEIERIELTQLTNLYRVALWRKSEGLREAVHRGLINP